MVVYGTVIVILDSFVLFGFRHVIIVVVVDLRWVAICRNSLLLKIVYLCYYYCTDYNPLPYSHAITRISGNNVSAFTTKISKIFHSLFNVYNHNGQLEKYKNGNYQKWKIRKYHIIKIAIIVQYSSCPIFNLAAGFGTAVRLWITNTQQSVSMLYQEYNYMCQ